ncbi:MAG: molybdenum cofactor guanylyltransferase [Planctomycetales bacterium]|nr:molybdenum cofactor guanylyltransferase [Planctomycetales bacterium]
MSIQPWHIQNNDCPAYVLAGGRSSRFGSNKALVRISTFGAETTLLQSLLDSLRKQGHVTHVVADNSARFAALGIICLEDRTNNQGPLAGLETALQHRLEHSSAGGWLLLVSCDQLLWQSSWFLSLAQTIEKDTKVVCFQDLDSKELRPLPALFHTDCLPEVSSALSTSSRSLRQICQSSHCRSFSISQTDGPGYWCFNTQPELAQLQSVLNQITAVEQQNSDRNIPEA